MYLQSGGVGRRNRKGLIEIQSFPESLHSYSDHYFYYYFLHPDSFNLTFPVDN